MANRFKVRSGYHSDGVTTYRKGQEFTSDKALHKTFPNKFDLVGTDVKPVKKKKGKARYNSIKALKELGRDVTQKFPDALNQGLRVYQNEDGEHYVAKEDDRYTPLNKKPMTRVATRKFLSNHVDE